MSNSNDMLAGLTSSIFDDNDAKFDREQSFGRKLLITAWAVEIMAASIGLIIAFTMAYDAYSNSEIKNVNASINALLGALPFLLIAVIEPTKIPLAGGLYKVKSWGWKLLILVALLGLTAVTFETLFTGLERQVTNITAEINRGKNSILLLEKENEKIQASLLQLRGIDLSKETEDLDAQIEKNKNLEEQDIAAATSDYQSKRQVIDENIELAQDEIAKLESEKNKQYQNTVNALQASVDSYNAQISERQKAREQLRGSLQNISNSNNQDDLVVTYNNTIDRIRKKIEEVERWLRSTEAEQIKKAQREIGVVDDGKAGENTRRNFDLWTKDRENEIELAENNIKDRLLELSSVNEKKENRLNEQISQLTNEIDDLEIKRAIKAEELQAAQIGTGVSSTNNPLVTLQNNKIEQLLKEREQLDARHDKNLDRIRSDRSALQQSYEIAKKQIETKSLEDQQSIPVQEKLLEKNKNSILELEASLTEKAQNNQIYRFAQKYNGYEDILEVKEKDLTFVATIWFGSIALVCATVGTILALISNIMTDPDAFVEKQNRRRNNRVARSIRKLSLAFRKRLLLKPKIIQVEVPVEVEQIVEVEKVVEKIVEKPIRQEVDKLVPEIVPIPVYVPNGGDPSAEVEKVANHYAELNKKVQDSFNQTARKHEDYDKE